MDPGGKNQLRYISTLQTSAYKTTLGDDNPRGLKADFILSSV